MCVGERDRVGEAAGWIVGGGGHLSRLEGRMFQTGEEEGWKKYGTTVGMEDKYVSM